jgi:hypothetical protein
MICYFRHIFHNFGIFIKNVFISLLLKFNNLNLKDRKTMGNIEICERCEEISTEQYPKASWVQTRKLISAFPH